MATIDNVNIFSLVIFIKLLSLLIFVRFLENFLKKLNNLNK